MALKIKGGKVGSVKKLKESLKRSTGFIRSVPKDNPITVRFLTEPEEFYEYQELYVKDFDPPFFPVTEGMDDEILGMAENKPSKRYLACVVDVADNNVIPLKMPKSLVESLMKKHRKYGSIMDRDYELMREGDGFDTSYDAIPESPRRFNFSKYELLDLDEILIQALPKEILGDDDDEDLSKEDDDDTPIRSRKRPGTSNMKKKLSSRRSRDDEDDDDDDDDDDEEDYTPPRRKMSKKPSVTKRSSSSTIRKKPGNSLRRR